MSTQIKAHIALLLVALIYGANYTIAKDVMNEGYLHPYPFILLRVSTAVILFWIFHQSFVKEKIEREDIFLFFICGILGIAINQLCFFAGLAKTTPIHAALIMTTTPMLVLIASVIMLSEKITWRKVFGIALGAMGAILLIAYGKETGIKSDQIWGDLLIFTNATSYAIYLVLARRLVTKYKPITVAKWIFTFGLLFVIPFGAGGLLKTNWSSFTVNIWLAVAYVLICTTFLAYLLNTFALKMVSASVVSIYIYLQPIFATLVALLLAKESLSIIKIISAVFIFSGVFLVSIRRRGRVGS